LDTVSFHIKLGDLERGLGVLEAIRGQKIKKGVFRVRTQEVLRHPKNRLRVIVFGFNLCAKNYFALKKWKSISQRL
jgi:hypothetical protein